MVSAAKRSSEVSTSQTETRSRPIDLVYLARQTLGDPGLEKEVLMLFSTMAATYFKRLNEARDMGEVALGLHSLKGAARGVGAGAIAVEAAAAETELAETGKVSAERLSDLAIAVEEVQAFVSELLDKEPELPGI